MMENLKENPPQSAEEMETAWTQELDAWVCERCDWAFLAPKDGQAGKCPHCHAGSLARADQALPELPYTHPPELVAPFSLPAAGLNESIRKFASGIPFAPADLSGDQLKRRMRRILLPAWLVDSRVEGFWKAEAGFDYQVVSHQESFDQNRGQWLSREIEKRRTRWEMRLGRLRREYHNILAPAIENQAELQRRVGGFDLSQARPFNPEDLQSAWIRLPNRATADAWNEARAGLQKAAAEECRQAAGADSIRQFSWQPEFFDQHWTLMLSPLYSSYYLDDQGLPQPVLVNGQSGVISGSRRASGRRARQTSLALLIAAVVLFLISLVLAVAGVVFPPALVAAGLVLLVAFLCGLGALVPIGVVWWFNRNQAGAV